MEAQMYHTPVVASDLGGTAELVRHGVTGELFEGGNKDDLMEKILKMWNDKELCAKYAENCRKIVFDTLAEYAEKVLEIYKSI